MSRDGGARATLTVWPATGVGEVTPGDDLALALSGAWPELEVRDGDVVVVTSKVVSKAEGRVVAGVGGAEPRERAITEETDRVVAVRGRTRIVRTRHGFVMAAAGVDASNVEQGSLVLLPLDPDGSARRLRRALQERWGVRVAVVVSDTAGRAWRAGQTDVALGAAGLHVLDDHAGRTDAYGNALAVTAPAVADQVAGAAELATGKLSGSPAALVRGLERFVTAADDDGPGAAALVRPEAEDLFALGAREAVLTALAARGAAPRGFGAPAPPAELRDAVRRVLGEVRTQLDDDHVLLDRSASGPVLDALLVACGWRIVPGDAGFDGLRLAPTPTIEPDGSR